MRRRHAGVILAAFVTVGLLLLGTMPLPAAPKVPQRLVAIPADEAPLLNGLALEAIWSQAPVLTLKTQGVGKWGAANNSETNVQLQAAYTRENIYFLVRWKDPSHSIDRQRWVLDGSTWQQQDQTPLDRGGANTYYEDKLAFLWVIKSPKVIESGTFWPAYVDDDGAAEAGYARPVKAAPTGEKFDLWHWKHVRTGYTNPAQVDDQVVDDTLDARRAPEAGRKTDPLDSKKPGGYYNNVKEYTAPNGTKVRGPRFYVPGRIDTYIITQEMIDRGEAREIADYAQLMSFPAGTRFPSVIGRVLTGSRGDLLAGHTWVNGTYTLEIGRRLDTGDPANDVIFSDLSKPYYFGVAVFDNAQIAHGASDAFTLVFQKR